MCSTKIMKLFRFCILNVCQFLQSFLYSNLNMQERYTHKITVVVSDFIYQFISNHKETWRQKLFLIFMNKGQIPEVKILK